jgi:hypothetical protein
MSSGAEPYSRGHAYCLDGHPAIPPKVTLRAGSALGPICTLEYPRFRFTALAQVRKFWRIRATCRRF